jgi:hypothetical protein
MFAGVDSDGAIAGAALPDISAAESETLCRLSYPLIIIEDVINIFTLITLSMFNNNHPE